MLADMVPSLRPEKVPAFVSPLQIHHDDAAERQRAADDASSDRTSPSQTKIRVATGETR
jgi:hypothetical protein